MKVEMVDLPAVNIIYMRYVGPYGPAIGAFWNTVFFPWLLANGLEGRERFGIGHDDPSITPPEKCRYDACVEVDADFVASGQALSAKLPGGRYAVAKIQG